jgi:hypothetical protein
MSNIFSKFARVAREFLLRCPAGISTRHQAPQTVEIRQRYYPKSLISPFWPLFISRHGFFFFKWIRQKCPFRQNVLFANPKLIMLVMNLLE